MTSTWTDLSSGAPGDLITDDFLDDVAANLDYLRNPPDGLYALSTGASNLTTSSASMVDLTSYSVTITVQDNVITSPYVEITLMGRATSTTARFDFLQDGVSITGDSDGLGAPGAVGFVTIRRIVAATAGSHTYKVQWKSTSGTVTWYAAGLGQLYVRQIR